MNTIENIHFTLLISINHQLHEFNFRQRNPDLYDADTGDERGNRCFFKMIRQDNRWRILGKDLPGWITGSEEKIHEGLVNKEN